MIKKTFCLVVMLLVISISVYSQEEYLYENITVAEGLSSASFGPTYNIVQDNFGFLWFGTVDGLNQYDGYSFKVFKNIPGDTTSLPSSNIMNVNLDDEGNLWVITDGSISRLNRKTNTFTNYTIESVAQGRPFGTSLVDSKGQYWATFLGGGLYKWQKDKNSFESIMFNLEVANIDTLVKTENAGAGAMLELSNGNLLVSTFGTGIYFYNESTNECDPYSLAGNPAPIGIIDLFEDKGGNIWITGQNHIVEYNPVTFNYESIDAWRKFKGDIDEIFFWGINELDDGTLFLNSMPLGLAKYNPSSNEFELVKIGGDLGKRGIGKLPATKYIDRFGIYWIGLFDNGILKYDPQRRPFRYNKYDSENSGQSNFGITTAIKANAKNSAEVFLATNRKGIFTYNLIDRKMENLNIKIPGIYSDASNVGNIVQDDYNNLWFSDSRTQISSYNLDTKKIESFEVTNVNLATGGGQIINGLEYLPKDNLIVSTNFGIIKFNVRTKQYEAIKTVGNRKYNEKLLTAVREITKTINPLVAHTEVGEAANLSKKFIVNDNTNFLVVCLGEGLIPQGMFDFGSILDANDNIVWSMNEFDKTFNANGGFKNRLSIDTISLAPGEYKLIYGTDIGHSYANFNVVPPDDSTWYGIQLFDLDDESFSEISALVGKESIAKSYPNFLVSNRILVSRKYPNSFWIAAGTKGIFRYDLNSGKFNNYTIDEFNNSNTIFNYLFEDSKGVLWIVGNPAGFYRFDPEKEKFYSNIEIADLPQTAINSIIEDFQGNIWINSSGGITKLSKDENEKWSTASYDSRDGVPGGFGSGSLVTRSGEILFGSFNGVIAFYPSSENTYPPIPIISNITISDKSIFDPESKVKLDQSIYETENLTLSYAQNDVSFDFASLHFSRPSKNRVSYKLEGFNENWIFTDKNFASFTNLDPGEYNFKVKAHSGYGVTSEDERSIKIVVNPPWYRTTLAYVFYVFGFVLIVFAIDRIQRRRLLTKARNAQALKEAEFRAQLAESESARKTQELEEARNLQLSMLPEQLPELPNLDIAVYMKTATEVGGDYYDFHVGMDGTLTVVLGDATGHGMKAGTMVTSTKSLFNVLAPNPDIVLTFHEMTRCLKLMKMEKLSMCMTMLKIKGQNLTMSAAGMPPVFIYKKESRSIEEYVMKGMPLGTMDNFPYDVKQTTLETGDTIIVMSDGFPELMNERKEMYGYKEARNKFEEVAEGTPEQIIDFLKLEGSEWTGGSDPGDDVTFVVIKVK